jgi:hypothetical protein
MTRGKKLDFPPRVVVQAAEPKFASVEEAWAAIGAVPVMGDRHEARRHIACRSATTSQPWE